MTVKQNWRKWNQ